MKTILKIITSFIVFTAPHLYSFGQLDTIKSTYSNLDTIIYYGVHLASGPGKDCNNFDLKKKKIKYYVNCKKVTEKKFLIYKNANTQIIKCKPCVLMTLSENGIIERVGVHYTDCRVGYWIEYYPNNKVKIIGHYKENDTGNWEKISDRGYCSKKDGIWTYYDENGKITKTEKYADGKQIE